MRKSIYDALTGQVVNVILLGDEVEYTPPEGYALGPEAEIGDSIINGEVVPQEVEIPAAPPLSLLEQLTLIFKSLDEDTQADLGPLAAAVFMYLGQNNPAVARKVIVRATIPPDLEALRNQMLEVF